MNKFYYEDKEIELFETFFKRFRGLMFRKKYPFTKIALLSPCKQIHTFFMFFPIGVVYLSKDWTVLWKGVVPPWRIGPFVRNTYYVMEFTDFQLLNCFEQGAKIWTDPSNE